MQWEPGLHHRLWKAADERGDPSDPDFAERMDAILVIEGKQSCRRWGKLKVICIHSEEKQD